jgi:mono/diheme cytochrome c family protein
MRIALLALVLAVLVVLNLLPLDSGSGRSRRFLPEMDRGPAVDSFAHTDLLRNSMAQQLPPFGTVAVDPSPLPYNPSEEDAERAGRELRNPIEAGDPATAAGGNVFGTFCLPCHGSAGLGDGTVVARGFPTPPSLVADHARELPDGRIFHVITFGQANMPSYAAQLTRRERWEVIHFLRDLQAKEREP